MYGGSQPDEPAALPITVETAATNRRIAPGSPALRVGLSSPIDRARKRSSHFKCHRNLVQRWSGVATVGILGEWRINEIQDIDIDMYRQRTAWQVTERFDARAGWIEGKVIAGRDVQPKPPCLLSLPIGSRPVLDSQPRNLIGFKEGSWTKHVR